MKISSSCNHYRDHYCLEIRIILSYDKLFLHFSFLFLPGRDTFRSKCSSFKTQDYFSSLKSNTTMNLRVWPDRDLPLINTYTAASRLERAEKCARTIISYLHVPSYLIGRMVSAGNSRLSVYGTVNGRSCFASARRRPIISHIDLPVTRRTCSSLHEINVRGSRR